MLIWIRRSTWEGQVNSMWHKIPTSQRTIVHARRCDTLHVKWNVVRIWLPHPLPWPLRIIRDGWQSQKLCSFYSVFITSNWPQYFIVISMCSTVCYKFKKHLTNSTSLHTNLEHSQNLLKTATPLRSKTSMGRKFPAENLDRHGPEQGVLQHKRIAPTLFEQEIKEKETRKSNSHSQSPGRVFRLLSTRLFPQMMLEYPARWTMTPPKDHYPHWDVLLDAQTLPTLTQPVEQILKELVSRLRKMSASVKWIYLFSLLICCKNTKRDAII